MRSNVYLHIVSSGKLGPLVTQVERVEPFKEGVVKTKVDGGSTAN